MRLTRCAGFWTLSLAVVHVAATPAFYGDSLRSILQTGVVGAVDKDPALATFRGAAFWYVTVGLFLGLVGAVVMAAERRGEGAPRGFAWAMGATGLWGVLLSPVSGFWLMLPIAWLARRNTCRQMSAPLSPLGQEVAADVHPGELVRRGATAHPRPTNPTEES